MRDLSLRSERDTLIYWKGSWEPHWPPHGSLTRIRWRRPIEHFALLPVALLGPGSWCPWGHVTRGLLGTPFLSDGIPLLLLLEDEFSYSLSLSESLVTLSKMTTLCL